MRAAKEVERENLQAALKSVREGNRKPDCRWYPAAFPDRFELRYPENETFREYGVVGKPMPHTFLRYWLKHSDELFSWADPLRKGLRSLEYALGDEGKRLLKDGNPEMAAQCLEPVWNMGLHWLRAEPRDPSIVVKGLSFCSYVRIDFKRALSMTKGNDELSRLARSEQQWRHFRGEFIQLLEEDRLSEDQMKLVLLGRKDPVRENRERVDRALRVSGLIESDDGAHRKK